MKADYFSLFPPIVFILSIFNLVVFISVVFVLVTLIFLAIVLIKRRELSGEDQGGLSGDEGCKILNEDENRGKEASSWTNNRTNNETKDQAIKV